MQYGAYSGGGFWDKLKHLSGSYLYPLRRLWIAVPRSSYVPGLGAFPAGVRLVVMAKLFCRFNRSHRLWLVCGSDLCANLQPLLPCNEEISGCERAGQQGHHLPRRP